MNDLLSVSLEDAMRMTGFTKCEFGPDGDECEKCDEPNKQHYWRRTDPFSMDGEYFCADCVIAEANANARYR